MSIRASRVAAGVAMVLAAGAARGQTAEAVWAWQVSTDGGETWRGGSVEVSTARPSVRVRCWIDWTDPVTNPYAFAGTQFDAIVEGVDGAGPADFVRDYFRPYPLDGRGNREIVAVRFGNKIKMDDARDTSPPGAGTRGLFPGQEPEDYAEGRFTTAKPISIFEYELVLDGTTGVRSITDIILGPTFGCLVRALHLYTTPSGMQRAFLIDPCYNYNDVIRWSPAEVVVVECRADFNADRQVDFFDYLDFAQAFHDEDSSADFNGDEQVDFMDYLDFVMAYDAGCA